MNTLCVSAQDIKWVEYAWLGDGDLQHHVRFSGMPEDYLGGLHTTLNDWGRRVADADRLFAVTGPGSFTANRVSVTMVNALAFVHNLPVAGLKNPDHTTLDKLVEKHDLNDLDYRSGKEGIVAPAYDRGPGITQPKKRIV
jgi:hypothetical protein